MRMCSHEGCDAPVFRHGGCRLTKLGQKTNIPTHHKNEFDHPRTVPSFRCFSQSPVRTIAHRMCLKYGNCENNIIEMRNRLIQQIKQTSVWDSWQKSPPTTYIGSHTTPDILFEVTVDTLKKVQFKWLAASTRPPKCWNTSIMNLQPPLERCRWNL